MSSNGADGACNNIQTWIATVIAVLGFAWGITNEILAKRKGEGKSENACVGDCLRQMKNSTIKRYALPVVRDQTVEPGTL